MGYWGDSDDNNYEKPVASCNNNVFKGELLKDETYNKMFGIGEYSKEFIKFKYFFWTIFFIRVLI
jgi:hypothetical protein